MDLTDKQINLNQLIFHKQENSINSIVCLSFQLLIRILQKFNKFLTGKFNNLEVEILLVGMGMLITDTRRFLSFQKFLSDFNEIPVIRIKEGFTGEDIIEAKFMLEYLFKLLRFIENNQPEILENININIPLSQKIKVNGITN